VYIGGCCYGGDDGESVEVAVVLVVLMVGL